MFITCQELARHPRYTVSKTDTVPALVAPTFSQRDGKG